MGPAQAQKLPRLALKTQQWFQPTQLEFLASGAGFEATVVAVLKLGSYTCFREIQGQMLTGDEVGRNKLTYWPTVRNRCVWQTGVY